MATEKPTGGVTVLPGRPTIIPGAAALALPFDHVQLASEDFKLWVRARLGEDAPTITAGYGGWESIARPGRRALTVWRGVDAPALSLALIFDGFAQGRSVERECRTLEKLAGGLVRNDPPPPRLVVAGAAIPHDASQAPQNRWVINELTWGDAIRRNDGERIRQHVSLTLLLFTQPEELERVEPRKPAPTHKVVRAHKGDTYEKLAARHLGSKRFGSKLARLNGGRSPDVTLKEGTQVKLPTASELAKWRSDLKAGR